MMEQTCPSCGAKNRSGEGETTDARASVCVTCGAALGRVSGAASGRRRAREYDGYAVGRHVIRIAPLWLLLTIAGFVLVVLFFSWASRPVGEAGASADEDFKNEATNRPPPARDARTTEADLRTPVVTGRSSAVGSVTATPAASPTENGPVEEASAFSVQVGAFTDISQANEQVSRLRGAGFEARVVESDAATRFHFQVRSGRYATREEAASLAAHLRAAGVASETVIIEPERK
ncbi:MAG: hypothetical protein QOJ70_3752 [Acidobacteriota bacterium]|nr:hypothetical protein [Acidobacteriota bacterium]